MWGTVAIEDGYRYHYNSLSAETRMCIWLLILRPRKFGWESPTLREALSRMAIRNRAVSGDAAATAANVLARELLFRLFLLQLGYSARSIRP
jgi:hypothetical protein